jgi:hypothetical protein
MRFSFDLAFLVPGKKQKEKAQRKESSGRENHDNPGLKSLSKKRHIKKRTIS